MNEQTRLIVAFGLSALILIGWQSFFAPPPVEAPVPVETSQSGSASPSSSQQTKQVAPPSSVAARPAATVSERSLTLSRGDSTIVVDQFLQVTEFKNDSTIFPLAETVGDQAPAYFVGPSGQQMQVEFSNVTDSSFSAISVDGVQIKGELDDLGRFNLTFNSPTQFKLGWKIQAQKRSLDNGQERSFVYLGEELEQISIGDDDFAEADVRFLGVDFHYHLYALVLADKAQKFQVRSTESGELLASQVIPSNEVKVRLVHVKKQYEYLATLGDRLQQSVDFGMFSILAVPILKGLQVVHEYLPNYGLAIIILTILIRLLTFPLQYKSFKSMKKMQEVQPQLAAIREKFKDDPQRVQRESMELFKRAGANPLGGCLPMLLQIPFFFAFYKVLYNSVELVDAPFVLWIHDLSAKDPYYVIPALMAGAMFLQQKFQPTAVADPVQKKIFMFMPLMFALIMKDLPAGLCLYMFVSTIFGILQQMMVYRQQS